MHVHHKLVHKPKNYQDPTMPNLTDSAHATNGAKPQRGPKLCHHRIVDGLDEPGLLGGLSMARKEIVTMHMCTDTLVDISICIHI